MAKRKGLSKPNAQMSHRQAQRQWCQGRGPRLNAGRPHPLLQQPTPLEPLTHSHTATCTQTLLRPHALCGLLCIRKNTRLARRHAGTGRRKRNERGEEREESPAGRERAERVRREGSSRRLGTPRLPPPGQSGAASFPCAKAEGGPARPPRPRAPSWSSSCGALRRYGPGLPPPAAAPHLPPTPNNPAVIAPSPHSSHVNACSPPCFTLQ